MFARVIPNRDRITAFRRASNLIASRLPENPLYIPLLRALVSLGTRGGKEKWRERERERKEKREEGRRKRGERGRKTLANNAAMRNARFTAHNYECTTTNAGNRSSGIIAGAKRAQPRAALNERGKNTMGKTRSLRLEEEEEKRGKRRGKEAGVSRERDGN